MWLKQSELPSSPLASKINTLFWKRGRDVNTKNISIFQLKNVALFQRITYIWPYSFEGWKSLLNEARNFVLHWIFIWSCIIILSNFHNNSSFVWSKKPLVGLKRCLIYRAVILVWSYTTSSVFKVYWPKKAIFLPWTPLPFLKLNCSEQRLTPDL